MREHLIRNERELNNIRWYILNNPLNWQLDRDNPSIPSLNAFKRWLSALGRWSVVNSGDDPVLPNFGEIS